MAFRRIKGWIFTDKNQYLVVGIFFLILQGITFYANYEATDFNVFFWFCNHTPLIFGLAFIFKKFDVIKALINVGFLSQFLWTTDFLSKVFFDTYLLSITRYVFEDMNGMWVLIPILIHMLGTNLAFFMTYKRKPKIRTLLYSLVYLVLIFGITTNFTLEERNINCIQQICGLPNLTFPNYTYFWPAVAFFLIIIPTQGIQYLIYRLHRRRTGYEN
ncbi:MAG: hypothetical protein Q8R00_05160 [Candidatus Nanoarchaeia archaeon]|nr:hypothetical protein [Candidatus Nanoarchaeia archaeon]